MESDSPKKSKRTRLTALKWKWARNSKITTEIIYLDFSKAFDKVCHDHVKLFTKLQCYGISGNTLQWIKNFLIGRTQVVKVENDRSNIAPVLSGIGKGTCLGPLLFILYLNDLAILLEDHVYFTAFADNIKIWHEVRSESVQIQLKSV